MNLKKVPNSISCSVCVYGILSRVSDICHCFVTSSDICQCFVTSSDICPSGTEYMADSCSPCPRGEYRTQNVHTECLPCDIRFTTPTDRAQSEDECVRK